MMSMPSVNWKTGLAVGLGVIGAQSFIIWRLLRPRQAETEADSKKDSEWLKPPLPQPVVEMLRASRLCHLATSSVGEPHLSLMNFSYFVEDEVVIFCTRRDTKKYHQILEQPNVAILIHDFPNLKQNQDDDSKKTGSITLNGLVEVCEQGSVEEAKYRKIHLAWNSCYAQFIVGDQIAVFIVHVQRARMADINDKVTYWSKDQGNNVMGKSS